MWKALFLAIGISVCIMGGECLLIEKAVLAATNTKQADASGSEQVKLLPDGKREYTPPDWLPWTLLSVGAVVILYSFTIPHRVNGK